MANKLIFRIHAIQRMFQRAISEEDVRHILKSGKMIEDYPDDTPYPSQLVLGWCGQRPLHVVAAYNRPDYETIIVTAYEPDLSEWENDFSRRKKR